MSGGSMNYAYSKINEAAEELNRVVENLRDEGSDEKQLDAYLLAQTLVKLASMAVKDVEWVESGDTAFDSHFRDWDASAIVSIVRDGKYSVADIEEARLVKRQLWGFIHRNCGWGSKDKSKLANEFGECVKGALEMVEHRRAIDAIKDLRKFWSAQGESDPYSLPIKTEANSAKWEKLAAEVRAILGEF